MNLLVLVKGEPLWQSLRHRSSASWGRVLGAVVFASLSLAAVLPWPSAQPEPRSSGSASTGQVPSEAPGFEKPTLMAQMEWAWDHDVEWVDVPLIADKRKKSTASNASVESSMQWGWRGALSDLENAWGQMEPAIHWDGTVHSWTLRQDPQPSDQWMLSVVLRPYAGESWPTHHPPWPQAIWKTPGSFPSDVTPTTEIPTSTEVQRWRYLGWVGMPQQPRVWLHTQRGANGWTPGQRIDNSDWKIDQWTTEVVTLVNASGDKVALLAVPPQERKR